MNDEENSPDGRTEVLPATTAITTPTRKLQNVPTPELGAQLPTHVSFYVDHDPPAVGIIYKNGTRSEPRGDFSIELHSLVEAACNTGYLATVERAVDRKKALCFFSMESASYKSKFMKQINSSFGSGGMGLALSEVEFQCFILFLKSSKGTNIPIKKAATTIGRQPCGKIWVLGKNLQINHEGYEIPVENSQYIWLDPSLLGEISNVPSSDLLPSIRTPLSKSLLPICRLLSLCKVALQHNFVCALLTIGGGLMKLHYNKVVEIFSGCPIVICNGPAETGKSTSIRAALSFCGSQVSSMYVKGSNAFFLERSSISTLPYAIDDPPKSGSGVDLNELVIDLYNTCKNANLRRGSLVPKSVPIIATNFSLKDEERVKTRSIDISFTKPSVAPTNEDEEENFSELQSLITSDEMSSMVGWAIGTGKLLDSEDGRKEVKKLKDSLRGTFTGRSQINWAILLFFVKKLLEITSADLCISLNDVLQIAKYPSRVYQRAVLTEDVLVTSLRNVVTFSNQRLNKRQVLQYMRTNCEVDSTEVVALVLEDAASVLSTSCSSVKEVIDTNKLGWSKRVTKDFLSPSSKDFKICRSVNAWKRKCCAIKLCVLPEDLKADIKRLTSQEKETHRITMTEHSDSTDNSDDPIRNVEPESDKDEGPVEAAEIDDNEGPVETAEIDDDEGPVEAAEIDDDEGPVEAAEIDKDEGPAEAAEIDDNEGPVEAAEIDDDEGPVEAAEIDDDEGPVEAAEIDKDEGPDDAAERDEGPVQAVEIDKDQGSVEDTAKVIARPVRQKRRKKGDILLDDLSKYYLPTTNKRIRK